MNTSDIVVLDTQIMIWGVKGQATDGQEKMICRAKAYLQYLGKIKAKIMLPSVVVGEMLVSIPIDKHPAVSELLRKRFIIVPYDLQAANVYARLYQNRIKKKEQDKKANISRREIVADFMIVASAIARGATKIISHDKHLKNFAKGFIEVEEIPIIPHAPSFDELPQRT
ncbi:MAG: PIN domain-containing protein [Candidatus Ozemobacteraceae bacterium]